jgi:hypothetical protein
MNQELMETLEADHLRAMEWVDKAQEAKRRGDTDAVSRNFTEAFRLEKQAAEAMLPYLDVEPTRSVLLRSAASLALECQRNEEAERLACLGLPGKPPVEIRAELRDVLMTLWQPVRSHQAKRSV